jgi:hypothetical protein
MGPDGQQQQNNTEPQFDIRRDMHATIGKNHSTFITFLSNYLNIGGLNASLGLAYGVTQLLNLGVIGLK